MAIANKKSKTKAVSKPKAVPKKESKPSAPAKPKLDVDAFVFETEIEKIEQAMERLFEQEDDPMAEPLTKDEIYWLGIWTLQLPDAKRRGMKTVPTSAREAAVLGLYNKQKRKKK